MAGSAVVVALAGKRPLIPTTTSSSSRSSSTCRETAIDSSNIGFQLLKKHGWKEGTGLGISEQGRLEPVKAYLKTNKRGVGADIVKKKIPKPIDSSASKVKDDKEDSTGKKSKPLSSKKQKKMEELEKRLQEKEFERAFFREFWPDNV